MADANDALTATLTGRDRDLTATRADIQRLASELQQESGKRARVAERFAETKTALAEVTDETSRASR
ncbi:hypothetical protein [Streptosporangium sp. KLBMP 9127]|nr:hypothetical protein [Streptosporangium sp. KLBMP 9127]